MLCSVHQRTIHQTGITMFSRDLGLWSKQVNLHRQLAKLTE